MTENASDKLFVYRKVRVGEILREGDEWYSQIDDEWYPTNFAGTCSKAGNVPYATDYVI